MLLFWISRCRGGLSVLEVVSVVFKAYRLRIGGSEEFV